MKKIISILIIFVIIFSTTAFANQKSIDLYQKTRTNTRNGLVQDPDYIKFKTLSLESGKLQISGKLPVVTLLYNEELTAALNKMIEEKQEEHIEEAKKLKAKKIYFDYDEKIDKAIHSIILSTTITTSSAKTRVDSFNFDITAGKILTMNDLLGTNGVLIANKVILSEMKKTPEKYNPGFEGISESQSFSVENNILKIIFDDYELSDFKEGIEIKIGGISDLVLEKGDYYTKKEKYELKMIPLRTVCEHFNFVVTWNDETGASEITRNAFATTVSSDKNSYVKNNGTARTLEAAPEKNIGAIHVPISFFEEILDLTYSVDKDGKITFSEYNEAQ